jgi:hypothetical protein
MTITETTHQERVDHLRAMTRECLALAERARVAYETGDPDAAVLVGRAQALTARIEALTCALEGEIGIAVPVPSHAAHYVTC